MIIKEFLVHEIGRRMNGITSRSRLAHYLRPLKCLKYEIETNHSNRRTTL
jgi:hypothetical protein